MSLPHRRLCRGLFIVFEGVDGAGKTTQVRLLDERLRREGYDVVCLKEPTEGPWGQKLRHLAQHGRERVSPATELDWFIQDRREDVEQNIRPALARGQIVLLDRYYFSTIAYQGALQLDPEEIRVRNEAFAPPPDRLFILDIPPERGLQRVRQRGALSHFERLDYLARVAAIFAAMQFPYLQHIDASSEPTLVQERVWQAIAPLLADKAAARRRHDSAPDSTTAQEEGPYGPAPTQSRQGRLKTPSADAVAEEGRDDVPSADTVAEEGRDDVSGGSGRDRPKPSADTVAGDTA